MRLQNKNILPIGIDSKEVKTYMSEQRLKQKRGFTREEVVKFYEENKFTQVEVAKMFGIGKRTLATYLDVMGKSRKVSKFNGKKREVVKITLSQEIIDKLQAEERSASAVIEESLKRYFKNRERQDAKHRINIFAEPKTLEREPLEEE